MKRRLFWLALVMLVALVVAACGGNQAAENKPAGDGSKAPASAAPTALSFGTSSVGGAYYAISVGMAELITKKTGISVTAEAVGGSDANVRALKAKKIDLAMLNAGSVASAYRGQEPFAQDGKIPLRVLAQGQESLRQLVARKAAGINSVADLAGKKLIARRKSLQELELVAKALLKAYGVDPASVTILETAETNEAIEALKLGTADAAIIPGGVPAGFLTDLAQSSEVVFVNIPDDKLNGALKELGPAFHKAVIPAGTYRGQDQDVAAPAMLTELAALADLPDEVAYQVTKTLLDNPEELKAVHSAGKEWNMKNTLQAPPAPFHSGAIKYFKEKGVWTSELEELQVELLKQ